MITTVKLVITSIITSQLHYVCVCVCVCAGVLRTLKIYSLSTFQVYNKVLQL